MWTVVFIILLKMFDSDGCFCFISTYVMYVEYFGCG